MARPIVQAMICLIIHSNGLVFATLIFDTRISVVKTTLIQLVNISLIKPALDLTLMISLRIILIVWIIFFFLVPKHK